MFQSMIDDMKRGARAAMRAWGIIAVAALTSFVTLCFVCAAAFVFILDRYGLIQALVAGAGVFFIATIVLIIWHFAVKRRAERSKQTAKPAMQAAMMDPMMIAAGIQIVRAIGIKRLIPLLAIGGVALGLMAKSPSRRENDTKK
jgi:hypothetical protein